jgi:hypothetical protein
MKGIAAAAISLALACLIPETAIAQVASARPASTAAAAVPHQILTGELTGADHEHYREVPFDLPEGVTRLTIQFSYGGKTERSVIDLGLSDPERFRGWSGGTRDHMTLSMEEATPGYLPGPLPAGRWHLILGAPNIRPNAHAPFEARIFIERGPVPASFADAPLNAAPGWYRGDLHMHSGNSDGSCLSQKGVRVPCPVYRTVEAAAARGLDFIALTDHNTTAHYEALRELQPAFDKMLLVPGREITTFFGHSNVFGPTDFLDFRMTAPTYAEARKWVDAVNREGGFVSLNHAGVPSGESCMGCGWQVEDLPAGTVSAIEIVNGGTLAETGAADSPFQGLHLWESLLNKGQHVTGIGGSDNHDAGIPADKPKAIGTPTTVVYMQPLSVRGFLDGVRAGRVFVDVDGVKNRFLDLSASSGNQKAGMGDTLRLGHGTAVRFDVQVKGVAVGTVQLVVDGQPDPHHQATLGGAAIIMPDWTSDGARHWIRADVRDAGGRLVLIGNPIYIAPAK